MHSYNSVFFGDCVLAHRIYIQIINVLDGGNVSAGKYATPDQTPDYSYSIHIDSLHNDEATPTTVALAVDIVTLQDSPTYSSANRIVPIATVIHPDIGYEDGVVLHSYFPALEPIAGDRKTSLGKICGVLFQANHGGWFSRPISSNKLLQCYSAHTSRITGPSILFQMNTSIDTLLSGFLHYKLTRYATQAVECTNGIYDTISYASHNQTVVAACCLHSASSSPPLYWPTAYAFSNDFRIILQAPWRYKSTVNPLDIVQSVHMSFRSHLKKGNIVLLGE